MPIDLLFYCYVLGAFRDRSNDDVSLLGCSAFENEK